MMKSSSTLLIILGWLGVFLAGQARAQEILGLWRYDGFNYEDVRYPLPNPNLELTIYFFESGTNRLFWKRATENGFCERFAQFEIADQKIIQKVFWLNPKNNAECAKDPDMQSNYQTETVFSIHGNELWLHLDLNGKPFFYILKKVN